MTGRPPRADARAAVRHVEAICALGDRFAGEPGDAAVAGYVADVFARHGLAVERTPLAVTGYREERCAVVLNDQERLEALTPYYTRGTATPVRAPALYLGDDQRLERHDVAGRILVFEERAGVYDLFWLGLLAQRAADAGALGIVVVHPFPWPYRASMETGRTDLAARFAERSVPAVSVSATGGMALMRALGAGRCEITLDVRTALPDVSSDLVVGRTAGGAGEGERILLLAHRDVAVAPGANDNGSGIATVLELARLLGGAGLDTALELVSLPNEEGAAVGAAAYVRRLRAAGVKVRAAISFDMLAVGGPLRLVEDAKWPDTPEMLRHSRSLNALLDACAAELGYALGRADSAWGAGDAGRLLQAGLPVAWFYKPDDFRYHSREDTPEHVDGNAIKAAAEITALAVTRLAAGDARLAA